MMKPWLINIILCSTLALTGCGTEQVLLGTAESQLFVGLDDVTPPGRPIQLKARFQAGDLLTPRTGYAIRFYRRGNLYKVAETDDNGLATASFTPDRPGDYTFVARVAPIGITDLPAPAHIRITCRHPDDPIVVVDMDKTIVASGFHLVLIGDPAPADRSAEVLHRIADNHTVIYLTHRPDYFALKSKQWLQRHDYPPGPVLLAGVSEFLRGSRSYKTRMLSRLKQKFHNIKAGIGDKISDAVAYHENHIDAYLILLNVDPDDPEKAEQLARSLALLPESMHVVTDWDQIEQAFFQGRAFPPSRFRPVALHGE